MLNLGISNRGLHKIILVILLYSPTFIILNLEGVQSNCNRIFSARDGQLSGSFQSPNRSSLRPFSIKQDKEGNLLLNTTNVQVGNNSMICVYTFTANQDERVMLTFTQFRLRDEEPECNREYMDIYLKVKPGEDLARHVSTNGFDARFCTTILPRRLVSLYGSIVLVFNTELEPPSDPRPLFVGTFEYIKFKVYDQIGAPLGGSLCTHVIRSNERRDGEFQSITYPGVYIKGLKCSYKFLGGPRQRVRLEFLDLDVFSGGSHCPFDSMKIYDGEEETDPIISNICGSHKSLIVFSTRENLLITFTTLNREAEVQNRGFSAYFEFSDKFVDTSFIRGQNVRHVRGSECDQRVISHRATKGFVVSPDANHHTNAICRYIFEGLQTSVDNEKVQLKFTEFDLKSSKPASQQVTSTTQASPPISSGTSLLQIGQNVTNIGETSAPSGTNSSADLCPDNYIRVYTSEQKPDQKQDPNDYDYIFCGNELPQAMESDAASLLMEYNSGLFGGSFKAEYSFIIDFKIPGTQITPGCDYIYRSEILKSGTINSPRHPSWYINDINCSYTFFTKQDEVLLLQFGTFKMSISQDKSLGYNEACLGEDLIEVLELTLDSNEARISDQSEIGTYCGLTTPGPILSYRPLRINFRANQQQVNYGFSALYSFYPRTDLRTNEFVTNCGGQITANQRVKTGTIVSPDTYRPETYEKRNHICSWNITARPTHRIAIDFTRFELEGSPTVRGCNSASVRLDFGSLSKPKEICGILKAANKSAHQFVSDGEWLSLTFISTKQASGSKGFAATWTEIKRLSS